MIKIKMTGPSPNILGTALIRVDSSLGAALTEVKSHLVSLIRANASGRILRRRSGRLEQSIYGEVKKDADGYNLKIASTAPYARIQDEGGQAGRKNKTRIKPSRFMSREINADVVMRVVKKYLDKIFK